MARYIDVEKLCEGLREMASVQYPDKQNTILGVISTIENTPTADVVEVRHGEWEAEYSFIGNCFYYYCSICRASEPHLCATSKQHSNYCPNCGAKMDGGKQ